MRSLLLSIVLIVFASCAFAQQAYYQAFITTVAESSLSGEELKASLHDLIDDHQTFPYTSSSTDTWDILKESDRDPMDSNNVILFYCGASVNGAQEYNDNRGWSREHVWAKSRGDFGTRPGAGTDVHHLKPADIRINSTRNNRNFDYCSNCEPVIYNGTATGSQQCEANYVFEPRDEVKGDVARMIFYMDVRYEGDDGIADLEVCVDHLDKSSKDPFHSNVNTLLEWHHLDPVDAFERNRNDVIFDYQGNRNPFIDYPELAAHLWGDKVGQAWSPDSAKAELGSIATTFTYETMRVYDSTNNDLLVEVRGASTFSLETLGSGAYRIEFIGGPFDGTSIHLTRQ